MSSADGYGRPHSIGRRLRHLRGIATQEAFGRRIGVSRSSLANYETGRSVPSDTVIGQIAERLGIHPAFFSSPEFHDDAGMAPVVGMLIEGWPTITDDEVAILRLLRLCTDETAQSVLRSLIEGIRNDGAKGHLAQLMLLPEDFQRVVAMLENGGRFARGEVSHDGETMMRLRAERREKRRHAGGPQSGPQSPVDDGGTGT